METGGFSQPLKYLALRFLRWKMNSSKHRRAADVEARPMGRKAMVTLEYLLGVSA